MLIMPFGCLRFLRESCLLYAFSLGYLPSIFLDFFCKTYWLLFAGLQFVPDYLAKLSSAAHPLSRFAPLLRQFAFGKRCPDEDDSGVAGTQRFLYHREYLFAFGLRFQGFFGRSDAERAWNGFKSGKWHLKKCDFSPKQGVFSPLMKLSNSKIPFLHKKTVQSAQKSTLCRWLAEHQRFELWRRYKRPIAFRVRPLRPLG